MIIFFKNLINKLEKRIFYYGGKILSIKNHISQYYQVHSCLPKNLLLKKTKYCNGRFYFLHKEAVLNLLEKKNLIIERYIEDHAIGYFLDKKYKGKMLPINNDKYFKDF